MTASNTNLAWTVPANATSFKELTKKTFPIPTNIGPHQVLVRLTAASLNYRDILVASHSPEYPTSAKPNLVVCSDGAGVIHAAGADSKWAGHEGTKVILHPNKWLSGDVQNLDLSLIIGAGVEDGTLQQWRVEDDERIVEAPKNLTGVESASLKTAGATAWSAIREGLDASFNGSIGPWKAGKRLEGKTILTMGTGGVSCFAIQIASALGATVIATSSSNEKLAFAKEIGATHLINYTTTPEWDQEVLRLTNGKGVDQVIEVAGAHTLMRSINSTRRGGLISLIGILTGPEKLPEEFVPSVFYTGRIIKGCVAFSRDATSELARFVEKHNIKPVIAKEFEFDDAVQAFEALARQNSIGKIVIKIADE